MGAGKTTIGKVLARLTGFDFIDLDEIIELRTGKTVSDILAEEGESYFRKTENRELTECVEKKNIIVSLGGGTLIDQENVKSVKENGVLVHLSATPETLWERVRFSNKRPLLRTSGGELVPDSDAVSHVKNLLAIRQKGYSNADALIATDDKSVDEAVECILKFLSEYKTR